MPHTISAGNQYLPKFGEQFGEQQAREGMLKQEMANRLMMQKNQADMQRMDDERQFAMKRELLEMQNAARLKLASARGGGGSGSTGGVSSGEGYGALAMTPSEFAIVIGNLHKGGNSAEADALEKSVRVIKDKKGKNMQVQLPSSPRNIQLFGEMPSVKKSLGVGTGGSLDDALASIMEGNEEGPSPLTLIPDDDIDAFM